MNKYSNGTVSVGDPVEVQFYEILNLRGDKRVTWVPATVAGVQPHVTVVFADSTQMTLQGHDYRIPDWCLNRSRKVG